MSNEIEKWRQSGPPVRGAGRRDVELVKTTIARWKSAITAGARQRIPQHVDGPLAVRAAVMWVRPANPPAVTTEQLLDLPRICAGTGLLWAARYKRESGETYFRYLRSTVSESYQCVTHYGAENWRSAGNVTLGVEVCPHCGAFTNNGNLGSVWCPGCQQGVCYGQTSRSGYFICHCGFRGQLVDGQIPAHGYR